MRPEDIKNRTFANALRGYDKDEVRSFLFRVAESSRELHEQLTTTEAKLAAGVAEQQAAEQRAAEAVVDLDVPGAGLPTEADTNEGFGLDAQPEAPAPETAGSETVAFETAAFESDAADTPAYEVEAVSVAPAVEAPLPAAEAFVEAPTESLAAAEQSIADRYGAIGDRIADLLRNADISAEEILASAEHDAGVTRASAEAEALQVRSEAEDHASQLLSEAESIRAEADAYRDEVMAELATARLEQETALQTARTAAEAEVETFRVDSIEEITGLRSDAFVEIDELRAGANSEVDELRTTAQVETEALRESVLAEATASIADNETNAAQAREEAEADRIAARAELEDVRTEVSTLLEQARTQSEFIKQEADEIIRTKVRANFEQAQTRIDVLRNTEVASRERIVLAQTELASALNRLDSEPVPELDPSASPAVIEEAERRHVEIAGGVADAAPVEAGVDGHDADVLATDTIEADVIDTAPIDVIEAAEPEDDSLSSYFGAVPDKTADATTGDILSGFEAPAEEVVVAETAAEEAAAEAVAFDEDSFEETVSDPVSVGAFVDAADSDLTDVETDDVIDEGNEYGVTDTGETDDSGWAVTEVSDVESLGYEASNPVAEQTSDAFGELEDAEHVVIESAEYGDLPVRGDVSGSDVADAPGSDELPMRSQPAGYTTPESFRAASLADALPMEPEAPELGGATQEDALARLVREAMQEAVDSARKND